MAKYVAVQSGNWSAAGTWNLVENTPSIHASTNITVTGGGVTSATFTAPNLVNAVTGVAVFVSGVGTAGNLVLTLQEGGVDTAATISIAITSLKTSGWVFLKLATPYVYTTLVAGSYRWKANTSGASGVTTLAANSGGANFAYLSTDDQTAVPATNDDVFIAGDSLAEVLVTVDDTSRTVGSAALSGVPSARNVTAAINLSNNGKLGWNAAAASTLECKGQIEVAVDGYFQAGTLATPIPHAYPATLIMDQNGTSGNHPINIEPLGRFIAQGTVKTSNSLWKTTYGSGLGTAASPLIVPDSVDWAVGDRIVITGNASYDQFEERYIITKNSATSYVVSSTSGGAETALVYTHSTNCRVVNLQRSVVIKSKTTTESFYVRNQATTLGYFDLDWADFEYVGGTTTGAGGLGIVSTGAAQVGSCDYCVAYKPIDRGFSWTQGRIDTTYTGNVAFQVGGTVSNGGFYFVTAPNNKAFVDCLAIGCRASGFMLNPAANLRFTDCEAWNNNTANVTAGGFRFDNSNTISFVGSIVQANRTKGIHFAGMAGFLGADCRVGDMGSNGIDIDVVSDTYNDASFANSLFGSATLLNNYLNSIPGSEYRFDKYQQTENRHIWYTAYGSAQATGAGLADTTVRTSGSLAVRLSPEEATFGFIWEFKVAVKVGAFVFATGFIKKNATFGTDDILVEMFLPGSTVADASYTMPDDTEWNPFNIGVAYAGSINRYATVRISAKSAAAGAYCYVDDVYNGTNVITGIDVWDDGKPSAIMFEQLGDAAAVWAVSTDGLDTPSTTGYLLTKLLTVAKFLGLK